MVENPGVDLCLYTNLLFYLYIYLSVGGWEPGRTPEKGDNRAYSPAGNTLKLLPFPATEVVYPVIAGSTLNLTLYLPNKLINGIDLAEPNDIRVIKPNIC